MSLLAVLLLDSPSGLAASLTVAEGDGNGGLAQLRAARAVKAKAKQQQKDGETVHG